MKRYIGTKIIEAEPAYKVDGKTVQPTDWPVPEGSKAEEGYARPVPGWVHELVPQGSV